jgi:hypothetical protein
MKRFLPDEGRVPNVDEWRAAERGKAALPRCAVPWIFNPRALGFPAPAGWNPAVQPVGNRRDNSETWW